MEDSYRIEKDSLGEMKVPRSAYYGAQTQRAVENFPVSDLRFPRSFIRALGLIKSASAQINMDLGLLDRRIGEVIARAAEEIVEGKLDSQFVLDIFQTGSGTSTNMNANEVIANRALELLGEQIGSKRVHPNDHVNIGQSSNDVIPTAIHMAALEAIERRLIPSLKSLHESLCKKAEAFDPIVKTGRTHLQDATPVRLGQEFSGYASQVAHAIRRIQQVETHLADLALGGTAVGTGINMHPEFPERVIDQLAKRTGLPFKEAENHFEAQATLDAVVETSGSLKALAASLMKIANDIRWLSSGPVGEILLPAVQPGSSIMPGKINPVIAESVCQVAAQVMGNDMTITLGGMSGNFELNVMMPVTTYNLLQSIEILANVTKIFKEKCIDGIEANVAQCEASVERSLSLCTALAPVIGYDAAAEVAKEALRTGKTIREVTKARKILPEEEIDKVLDTRKMTERGF
ncbi:MAG: class II fumarate hydratase [Candidatus Tectomicrobia bacterium]|nr:class II fumarate hydratase [Candidatus Tectomicrobia bacterium]